MAYVDPLISHCLQSTLPLIWPSDMFRTQAQRLLYEDARSHGMRAGATFPIHGPNGEFGMLSFAVRPGGGSGLDARREVGRGCRTWRWCATMRSLRRCASARRWSQEAAPRLTPRELEVLNWVMVGKSSWEISKITSCSEATVNFHMGNIRQKFNVNTRQQAVVRAISLGLITPEDHHR
jgi:LuxR family quorum-sensing transcriptional regulator LasR